MHDVVFVAVDFRRNTIRQKLKGRFIVNSQVGIAILDTRDLQNSSSDNVISTFNLTSGLEWYCRVATATFLFGETLTVHQGDILATI